MQSILCIDLSSATHARAELVEVEGRTVKLLNTSTAPIAPFQSLLEGGDYTPIMDTMVQPVAAGNVPAQSSGSTALAVSESSLAEQKQDSNEQPAATPTPPLPLIAASDALTALVAPFKGAWTAVVLIAPVAHALSMTLPLPKIEPKKLAKILPLEVQDLVPFDLEDFLLTYRTLPPRKKNMAESSTQEVFVTLTPKREIVTLIAMCKRAEVDPLIITPPHALLNALRYIGPEFFSDDAALLVARHPFYYLSVVVEGEVRAERMIKARTSGGKEGDSHDSSASDNPQQMRQLLTELRVSIASFEHQLATTLSKVYLAGDAPPQHIISNLGRPVELLDPPQIARPSANSNDEPSFVTLFGVFAQDIEPALPFVNLRSGEFAYSPRLKDLMAGLSNLAPYLAFAAILFLLALTATYYARERYVDQISTLIAQKIRTTLQSPESGSNTIDIPEGLEVEALTGQINKLQTQLKELGSLSHSSPVDTFLELTKNYPANPQVTITGLTISGSRVRIQGTAPDYAAVEGLERTMQQRRDLFARVRSDINAGGGSQGKSFTLELFLKE